MSVSEAICQTMTYSDVHWDPTSRSTGNKRAEYQSNTVVTDMSRPYRDFSFDELFSRWIRIGGRQE